MIIVSDTSPISNLAAIRQYELYAELLKLSGECERD